MISLLKHPPFRILVVWLILLGATPVSFRSPNAVHFDSTSSLNGSATFLRILPNHSSQNPASEQQLDLASLVDSGAELDELQDHPIGPPNCFLGNRLPQISIPPALLFSDRTIQTQNLPEWGQRLRC